MLLTPLFVNIRYLAVIRNDLVSTYVVQSQVLWNSSSQKYFCEFCHRVKYLHILTDSTEISTVYTAPPKPM